MDNNAIIKIHWTAATSKEHHRKYTYHLEASTCYRWTSIIAESYSSLFQALLKFGFDILITCQPILASRTKKDLSDSMFSSLPYLIFAWIQENIASSIPVSRQTSPAIICFILYLILNLSCSKWFSKLQAKLVKTSLRIALQLLFLST